MLGSHREARGHSLPRPHLFYHPCQPNWIFQSPLVYSSFSVGPNLGKENRVPTFSAPKDSVKTCQAGANQVLCSRSFYLKKILWRVNCYHLQALGEET